MLTYAVDLVRRYDGLLMATVPDLPGVVAYGRDDEEAIIEVRSSISLFLARLLEKGLPFPVQKRDGGLKVSVGVPPTAAC